MRPAWWWVLVVWLWACPGWSAPLSLRLVYVDPPGAPVDIGARRFSSELKRLSQGTMVVSLCPSGRWQGRALGELDILQQVHDGGIDMCIVTTAPLGNYSRSMEILDTPFLFSDYAQVYRALDGPVGRQLLAGLQASGLRGLEFMDSGFRILTSSHPLGSLSDLRNKRIRVMQNEVYCNFVKLIGAVPIPSAVNVINDMVRKGYIDAADRSYPTYFEFGTNRVQKYVLESRHAYAAEAILINDALYRRLAPEQQQAILAAARIARDAQRRQFRQVEASVKQQCQRQGIQIRHLSAADLQAMRADCAPIYARLQTQYAPLMHDLSKP